MESANAFDIPRSLVETSNGGRTALLVNAMQVGVAIGVVGALAQKRPPSARGYTRLKRTIDELNQ